MLRNILLLFICLLFTFVFQSCQKRYWYRVKLLQPISKSTNTSKENKQKDTISVEVVNYSPNYLSPNYETTMKKACEDQLKKIGFVVIQEDSAPYHLLLEIHVDSFNTTGVTYFSGQVSQYNRKNVKAIMFDYLVRNSSNGNMLFWGAENDIFFFHIEKRDTRRSRGIVKYTIRHIP